MYFIMKEFARFLLYRIIDLLHLIKELNRKNVDRERIHKL